MRVINTLKEFEKIRVKIPVSIDVLNGSAKSPEEAMTQINCCLKSTAQKPNGGYAHYGILRKYLVDEVIVEDLDEPHTFYIGTQDEYKSFWRCD